MSEQVQNVEPVLTRTEVEAILEASRQDAGGGLRSQAESIDLLAGDRYIQQMIPTLQRGHVRLAESLRKVFTSVLRSKAEVRDETPEVLTGRGLGRVAEHAACLLALRTRVEGEDLGFSMLAMDRSLTFALVERLFGGAGAAEEAISRPLTPLERRVLLHSLMPVVEGLNETLEPRRTFLFGADRVECNLELIPGFSPDVTVLHVPFTMTVDDRLASLSLALPARVLEPLRATLCATPVPSQRGEMAGIVRRTPVELEVELGRARTTLRQVINLQVGTVLRLDRHPNEELPVRIAGMTKFQGLPVHDDGALAVEITRRID